MIAALVLLALTPTATWAHSPIPGIGRFYSGALHPLLVPSHLLSLLALGLAIGQRGLARTGAAAGSLLAALMAGLAIGHLRGEQTTDTLLLTCSAALALSVVLARPLPALLLAAVAGLVGVAIGWSSMPDGLAGSALMLSLAGTAAGAFLLALWVTAMTEFAKRPWMKIGVRVVGSWLAASALLVLALEIFGPHAP